MLFTKLNNLTVKLTKCLFISNHSLVNEEAVIRNGLNFKIVIEIDNISYIVIGLLFEYRAEKLTRFTRRANYKSLSMLFKFTFGNSRHSAIVFQIRIAYKLVKVFKSPGILNQNNLMIGFYLKWICILTHIALERFKVINIKARHLLSHRKEDIRKHFSVITRSVMVEITKIIIFCNSIKLMRFQV